jgi:hypothetical protein
MCDPPSEGDVSTPQCHDANGWLSYTTLYQHLDETFCLTGWYSTPMMKTLTMVRKVPSRVHAEVLLL